MLHEIMIILHAASAVLCFAFGSLTLLPETSHDARQRLYGYYLVLLTAMIVFLAGAILAHASRLDAMQRVIFPGLFLLSVYMLFRGLQARTVLVSHSADWFPRYVDHIGFTLIALFEGFIIVGGIDVGAPAWLTAAAAVLGVLAGNRTLHRLQAQGSYPAR